MVNTREEGLKAIAGSKYPPAGARSIGARRISSYFTEHPQYIEQANRETLVIVQIEWKQAVDNLEEIITLEGIDAWFIGPVDLTASLEHTGEINSPAVSAAMDNILRTGNKLGVPGGR